MIIVEAHGAHIPALGFGTWDLRGEVATRLVGEALGMGYRHIDTAAKYENEREVGRGIAGSGVPREEIFVTTKIWPDRFRGDDFRSAAKERLELLGLDHVDLLLLHWPNPDVPLAETIEALNWAEATGITRHVGVSNFTTTMLDEAVRLSTAPIVCNQFEYHPYLLQNKLLAACRGHGMAATAYCPIARGKVLDDPVLRAIGEAHDRSPIQVGLRWLVQQSGVIAIPRTSSPERAAQNLAVFDFELSGEEMARIDALRTPDGRLVNLDIAPEWDRG